MEQVIIIFLYKISWDVNGQRNIKLELKLINWQ